MKAPRYSARIGESLCIAENAPYESLLKQIVEFTARAAVARSINEDDWEGQELRRKGLAALQIFREGRAIWLDRDGFESELEEARRENIEPRFRERNELDPKLYTELDRNLRELWRRAGYMAPSLLKDMKELFLELERDAVDQALEAREGLVSDILNALQPLESH